MPVPDLHGLLEERRRAVAKSMTLCGQDYDGVRYPVAYIAAKAVYADENEVGCALACAPYVLLAQDGVPGGDPRRLVGIELTEWEEEIWGPGSHDRFHTAPTGRDGIHVEGGPDAPR